MRAGFASCREELLVVGDAVIGEDLLGDLVEVVDDQENVVVASPLQMPASRREELLVDEIERAGELPAERLTELVAPRGEGVAREAELERLDPDLGPLSGCISLNRSQSEAKKEL